MLREIWLISLVVRVVALAIGYFRAPRAWNVWAAFYILIGIALRVIDIFRPSPNAYIYLWCFQQIGLAVLACFLVHVVIRPTSFLVQVSALSALFSSGVIAEASHWPGSPTEVVMWGCGGVSLCAGIVSGIGVMSRLTATGCILAGFLILYSALMLAGSDYLNNVNLGIAWSVLEITAFGAWGIRFLIRKHC